MSFVKLALIFLWEQIENLLFPPSCYLCGKQGTSILCCACERKLEKEAKYEVEQHHENIDYFSYHFYIFLYQEEIRKLLLDFKFHDKSYLCELFIKILLKNEKISGFLKKYDIIMPVPIHKKRKAQRGYNQSELLAKQIVEKKQTEHLEIITNCLQKKKNTKPQSTLTKWQRIQNAKQVYEIQNAEKIKEKNIILIDDIYTTGSTVKECAKLLKQNGANQIIVITIAKD